MVINVSQSQQGRLQSPLRYMPACLRHLSFPTLVICGQGETHDLERDKNQLVLGQTEIETHGFSGSNSSSVSEMKDSLSLLGVGIIEWHR